MEVRDSVPQSGDRSGLTTSSALSRIRLRHLSCFVVVAQERTLARAAERLHLRQPAVSKTLTELERLAGHQLVERSRAGTQLTEAGERFLRYAVDVTRALDSAAAALTEAEPQRYPIVRVAALPTAAGGLLAQAIARLRGRRPHAGVGVQTGHNPELLAALRAGEADFAVGRIAEPAMMTGVSFELLYAESLAVVTRPEHRVAGPARLGALAAQLPAGHTQHRHRPRTRRRGAVRGAGDRAAARPDRDAVGVGRAGADAALGHGLDHPAAHGPARPRPGLAAQAQRADAGQRRAGRDPVQQRPDPGP